MIYLGFEAEYRVSIDASEAEDLRLHRIATTATTAHATIATQASVAILNTGMLSSTGASPAGGSEPLWSLLSDLLSDGEDPSKLPPPPARIPSGILPRDASRRSRR
jgi:hypothetical protein